MLKVISMVAAAIMVISGLVFDSVKSEAAPSTDYSVALNTTTPLSGFSVNSSISGTVRVLLRTDNSAGRLSVTSYSNLVGIRNTPNYTATSGNSALGTAGQMIGLVGPVASINAALATLRYSSTTPGTDTIKMWVSNGTEYIPLMNGSDVEFHYYVYRDDAATPAAAASMATAVGTIDGQTGVTTYLATLRYQVEDVFASEIMVAWGNRDQAWIAARDDVEGQWKWFGPDAEGVQFWNGDNSGIYSVNGEYWNWGRTAANSGLQRPTYDSARNCLMLNAASTFTYGLVRMNGGNNYWYGWHAGMCSYGTRWIYEALVPTMPAGQNTNVSGANYSMTPQLRTVAVASPPGAPTSLAASANSSGDVDLSWTAPGSVGSSAITDYTIQYSLSSTFASGVTTWSHAASTQTSASISGLTHGSTYYFRVAAVNTMEGSFSSTATLTLPNPPSAPTSLVATATDGGINVSWSTPSSNGGSNITGYKLEYKESSSNTWTVASSSIATTSYSLSSLSNGTNYDVRVSASNGFWGATAAATAVTPFGPVSNTVAPTISGANAAGEILTGGVGTWNTNGAAISNTTYQWQTRSNPSDSWTNIPSATNSTYVLTSNDVGKYIRLQVSRTNGYNFNALVTATSSSSSIIQTGLASTPGNLTTLFGNQSIQVSWSLPSSNGGTISAIRVEYSQDGDNWTLSQSLSASATSHTISGLTNGTGYFVRVTAVTAAGNGAYAISSDAIIPATSPSNTSVPTISGQASFGSILSASAGSWSSNGRTLGAANYQWQYSTDSGSTWNDIVGETNDQLTIAGNIGSLLRVKVTRSNAVGATIAYSVATSAVTASPASGPQNLSVTPGDQTLSITWATPANTGGVSLNDYQVQYSADAVNWTTVTRTPSLTTSQQVTGLTNGTSYYVRVRALNGFNGAWSFSGTTQAPRGLPLMVSAPTISGTADFQQLLTANTGQWNSNGSNITQTSYQWQTSPDGSTWVDISGATSNEYRVTAAVGNRLRLKVTQTNGVGNAEAFTSATTQIAAVNAAAPAVVLHETGDRQFTIRWTAPAHNGGVSISGYTVEYSLDQQNWINTSTLPTARELTVSGLTNGQSYYARVRAETDRSGNWSLVLGPIRPAATVVATSPAQTNRSATVAQGTTTTTRTNPVATPVTTDWSAIINMVMPVPIASNTLNSVPSAQVSLTPDGRIELNPSASVILLNGAVVPSAVISEQGSQTIAQFSQTSFELEFASTAGSALPGETIGLNASGFTPGSPLVVWIQSTPTKLKEYTANSLGIGTTDFVIPENLTPGDHTLQINGVDANGNVISLAYGITVNDPAIAEAGALSEKTEDINSSTLLFLVAAVLMGALIVAGSLVAINRRKKG
jgi:hypothetical protein